MSPITTYNGITQSLNRFESSVVRAVEAIIPNNSNELALAKQSPDIISKFIEMTKSQSALKASIAVIETKDEMIGSLLDLKT
jgi:hypothetical protein